MCTGASARKSKPSGDPKGLEYLQQAYFAAPNARTAESAPDKNLLLFPDGIVRFEQPDNEATSKLTTKEQYLEKFRGPPHVVHSNPHTDTYWPGYIQKMGDVYSNPTMYKDYPELYNTPVALLPPHVWNDKSGSFSDDGRFLEASKYLPNTQPLRDSEYGAFQINPTYIDKQQEVTGRDMAEYFRTLFTHEAQHWIDKYENTDMGGGGPGIELVVPPEYMRRPTEAVAHYAHRRRNLPPEERYGDNAAVEAFIRDNADWADSGIASLPSRASMSELEYGKALRKMLNEQRRK